MTAKAIQDLADVQLNNEALKKIQDVPLKDHPDIQEAILQAQLTPPRLEVGKLQFQFDAGVMGSLQSFNSPNDVDPLGVVGAPRTGSAESASGALQPLLTVQGERGYLKYQVTARVKAAGGVDVPFVAAEGHGEVTALLGDYHAHPLSQSARMAVIQDLGNMRSALNVQDLARLGEDEAVAFQVSGRLHAAVEVKWADVFAGNLALLSGIRGNELIGLKTSAGASVRGSVRLEDDFVVVFSRPRAEGRIRVAVRKGLARAVDGALKVQASVEFANPAEAEARLNEVVDALAGRPMAFVDELVKRASTAKLSAEEQQVLGQLLERMGLDPSLSNPASLQPAWEARKQQLRDTLKEIAESKLQAGFRYEYLRLAESATLLQVTLADTEAMRFHANLLRGELAPLTQWLRDAGREPEAYLHQESLTRDKAWGFSLNLGRWEFKSEDRKKLQKVVQRSFDGKRSRMAFLGMRSYEGITPNQHTKWSVDFKAETTRFFEKPRATDFYYGLHFLTRYTDRTLSEAELRSMVDEAIAWQVLDDADERAVLQELKGLADKERLETRIELKLDNDVLGALLTRAQALDVRHFAQGLARAMPWGPEKPRAQAEVRRIIYAPIWELYFRETERQASVFAPDLSPSKTAELVASAIRHHGIGKELYLRERTFQQAGLYSFAEINHKNPGVVRKWKHFLSGMNHLRRGIADGWSHEAVETAFGGLEELWQNHFHAKAVGAMLVDLALSLPEGARGVERTLTVTRPGKEALVFTTSRGSAGA